MIYYNFPSKFLLFAILFFVTAGTIFAAEGDLDPTFDGDGIVTTDNGGIFERINDLQVQPDGKIIVVGYSQQDSSAVHTIVVRYNSNGSVDTTFGLGGKVIIPTIFGTNLALHTDGKMVIVGRLPLTAIGESFNGDLYVARLNTDGSFDTAFNGTGSIIVDISYGESPSAVKIQSDGKIVVGGVRFVSPDKNDYFIARFNTDASLDTTFDGDGKVFTRIDDFSRHETLSKLAIQADGKILVAGSARVNNMGISDVFTFVRYNPNGSLDSSFDGDGKVLTQVRTTFPISPAALLADGKILVLGTFNNQLSLVRYNANGSLDSSFGTGGATSAAFGGSLIEIQADNKIVIAGSSSVARLNADGLPDVSFSSDGLSSIPLPPNVNAEINALRIQPDGKILVGGSIGTSSARDFLLARFDASSCTINCPVPGREKVTDFDGDGKTDLSIFRNGMWFINPSGANNPNNYYGVQFGLTTDKLTPADYDGDGKTDVAIWRENVNGSLGYFYIFQSSTNTVRISQFGQTGDDPRVAGDWDGDGKADLAFYRSGTSTAPQSFFFYRPSSQPLADSVRIFWGTAGDESVRGDFDGDKRMDAAVFRASDGIWYINPSSNPLQARFERWGLASDKRVSGDYDGDGKTDLAVYRDGLWAVMQSSNNQPRYENWGLSSDKLVAGDYDGDGRTDFAVWRAGVYYILQNSNSQPSYKYFGNQNDIPVASAFVR